MPRSGDAATQGDSMIIKKNGKWIARCDACGYESRYPRKDDRDIPKWWGGSAQGYLRCERCDRENADAMSELDAAGRW